MSTKTLRCGSHVLAWLLVVSVQACHLGSGLVSAAPRQASSPSKSAPIARGTPTSNRTLAQAAVPDSAAKAAGRASASGKRAWFNPSEVYLHSGRLHFSVVADGIPEGGSLRVRIAGKGASSEAIDVSSSYVQNNWRQYSPRVQIYGIAFDRRGKDLPYVLSSQSRRTFDTKDMGPGTYTLKAYSLVDGKEEEIGSHEFRLVQVPSAGKTSSLAVDLKGRAGAYVRQRALALWIPVSAWPTRHKVVVAFYREGRDPIVLSKQIVAPSPTNPKVAGIDMRDAVFPIPREDGEDPWQVVAVQNDQEVLGAWELTPVAKERKGGPILYQELPLRDEQKDSVGPLAKVKVPADLHKQTLALSAKTPMPERQNTTRIFHATSEAEVCALLQSKQVLKKFTKSRSRANEVMSAEMAIQGLERDISRAGPARAQMLRKKLAQERARHKHAIANNQRDNLRGTLGRGYKTGCLKRLLSGLL